MNATPNLEQLQRWMFAVIADPRGIESGIRSKAAQQQIGIAPEELEQFVNRSQACTSTERLAVYSHAYFARLLECLQAEYPVLALATGEEAFRSLAAGYLLAHPSTSYTLTQLGARLSDYLTNSRPDRDPAAVGPDWADFLVDLARLERTYSEVFDGPGDEWEAARNTASLSMLDSSDADAVRLRVTPSLRLLTLRFSVHETYASLRAGQPFVPPQPQPTQLAVYRRDYLVRRREISAAQATLLTALQRNDSLAAALDHLLSDHRVSAEVTPHHLHDWFAAWTMDGIIRGHEG